MSWKKLTSYKNQKVIGKMYGTIYWEVKNNIVWHQWKKMTKADLDTFEIYDGTDFIARDKNYIYHAWDKVKMADRNSFQKIDAPYWKDKNNIYFEYETSLKPLKGLDAKNFNYLGNGFGHDNTFAYYYGTVIKKCKHPKTFTTIKEHYLFSKDQENIYFEGASLKNVDISTWKYLIHFYSRDKKGIYYTQYKLPRVDIATWEYLGENCSKDKNKVYNMQFVVKEAKSEEWTTETVKRLKDNIYNR